MSSKDTDPHAPTVSGGSKDLLLGDTRRSTGGSPLVSVDLAVGTMVGEYRVEGKLGQGGMGHVFACVHPLIGKRAAIKVLRADLCTNPEAVERFVQEARSVNQIGHPNIVDVFSFGTLPDGRSYLVMEWLKGESLATRIERSPLSLSESAEILDPICAALETAHNKGIVHRDLKPDNVFLVDVPDARPIVKLLDFGIAKLLGNDDTRMERTRTGNLLGTPAYLSPEQARGKAVDQRTDIYSLGAMMYEMLTGRQPFEGESAMDVISSHLNELAEPPSKHCGDIPEAIDQVILDMLAKKPDARPTLKQLRALLAAIKGGVATADWSARAAIRSLETTPTAGRRWSIAALAFCVLAGGAFAIYKVLSPTKSASESGSAPTPILTPIPIPIPIPTPTPTPNANAHVNDPEPETTPATPVDSTPKDRDRRRNRDRDRDHHRRDSHPADPQPTDPQPADTKPPPDDDDAPVNPFPKPKPTPAQAP